MLQRTILAIAAGAILASCSSSLDKANEAAGRAQQLFAAGRYREAVNEAQAAAALRDDVPEIWLLIARGKMTLHDYSGAYQAYQRVSELDQSSIEALSALAELSLAGSDYTAANRFVDQLLLLNPRDVHALLVRGYGSINRGRTDEAKDIVRQVEAIDPTNPAGQILRARLALKDQNYAQGVRLLAPLAAQPDANRDVLSTLQDLYRGQRDWDGVERMAISLARLEPRNLDKQFDLIRELLLNGKIAPAMAVLARAVNGRPINAELQDRIADVWVKTETPIEAIEPIVRVQLSSLRNVTQAFARFTIEKGQAQRAIDVLEPITTAPVTRQSADAYGLAALARQALNQDRATTDADQILAVDPTNARALLVKARSAFARRDFDEAMNMTMVIIRDNPQLADARILLASIYAARNQPLLARDTLASAQQDISDSAKIMRTRGQFLIGNGKTAEALSGSAAFTRANQESLTGWRARGELCLLARNDCVGEAIDKLGKLRMGAPGSKALAGRRGTTAAGAARS